VNPQPVTLDMSTAQPIQAPVTLDMSTAQPIGGQQPTTLSSIGSGLEETGSDIWNAVKATVNPMTSGALGAVSNAYQHISEAVPLFQAYEGARSSGKGIVDSLSAANDKAKQIADAQDVLKQRVDEFRKNPTQATTRAVGDAAAIAASIWAGGKLTGVLGAAGAADVAPEAEASEAEAAGEVGTEAASAEEPGIATRNPAASHQGRKGCSTASPGCHSSGSRSKRRHAHFARQYHGAR
jgi:hypothetical protein